MTIDELDANAIMAHVLFRAGIETRSMSVDAAFDERTLTYLLDFDIVLQDGRRYQRVHRVDELVAQGNMDAAFYWRIARDVAALTPPGADND